MNITQLRCAIKFLKWDLKRSQRESIWRDEYGNFIAFTDDQIITKLQGKMIKHNNICNIDDIYKDILETIEYEKTRAHSDPETHGVEIPF